MNILGIKKIFLLIFVTFCFLIFYQVILGKNGMIEGYRVQKEREQLLYYKSLLEKYKDQLNKDIQYLKNNPIAFDQFATQLGFNKDDVRFIKIIDELEANNYKFLNNNYDLEKYYSNLMDEIKSKTKLDAKISNLRLWISVLFYLIFGMFIFLIIFGIQRKDE